MCSSDLPGLMAAEQFSSKAVPATAGADSHDRALAINLLLALRPGQWTKNLVVFAGLIFGQKLLIPADVATAAAAFGLFCVLSGVVYLVNDIQDRDADRHHPQKSRRPIASGALAPATAGTAAAILAAGALTGAYVLDRGFFAVGLTYLVLLVAYSVWLKHGAILDVLSIALGFVLRAYAGAVVLDVPFSHWLLVLTLLGALAMNIAIAWSLKQFGYRWNLSWQAALALGSALAMSSTAIVARLMAERLELDSEHGKHVMGVLLFQDLAVVPLLTLPWSLWLWPALRRVRHADDVRRARRRRHGRRARGLRGSGLGRVYTTPGGNGPPGNP